MSVKPILFSGPMVRAILEGRKTQTRRALKPQPVDTFRHATDGRLWQRFGVHGATSAPVETRFAVGDFLYARETGAMLRHPYDSGGEPDWEVVGWKYDDGAIGGWNGQNPAEYIGDCSEDRRPSIHMPRWASRITLVVENVRVERLQEISEEDAIAEGVVDTGRRDGAPYSHCLIPGMPEITMEHEATTVYAALWEHINGAGSWGANPWVVAITFRPILANVDAVLADPAAYGVREAA